MFIMKQSTQYKLLSMHTVFEYEYILAKVILAVRPVGTWTIVGVAPYHSPYMDTHCSSSADAYCMHAAHHPFACNHNTAAGV